MPSTLRKVSQYRKRKLIDQEPVADIPHPPAAKRQRRQSPASYWDNLSRLWFSRRALEELNRRNHELAAATELATVPPPSVPCIDTTRIANYNLADIQRFARHGGPDLSDIKGYPALESLGSSATTTMQTSQSGSKKRPKTGQASSPKKSSAYDPNFLQNLNDNGVFRDDDGNKPDNWAEIKARLQERRPSLSSSHFSEADFVIFRRANRTAASEDGVKLAAFPTIAGTATIPRQCNKQFNNLQDFPDGNITMAQPDWYDGSNPSELDKEIRAQLSEYIIPSTNTSLPLLPNFFVEGKGPDGSSRVCDLQAMQDATLGTRGMLAIRSYIDPQTAYNNNAFTAACTYYPSGQLTIFIMYATREAQEQPQYHMMQLRSFVMTDQPETFREGATFLRNARDLMKEYRDQHIAAANSKIQTTPTTSSLVSSVQTKQSDRPPRPASDSSADELSLTDKPSPDHKR
ncbi:MAG: hypothetical protein Q9207_003502 [Kuettlingeria erythrocarpa]